MLSVVVSARGSVLFHLASHVCFAYLEIMVVSLSWSAKRKASGRPRGTSGKLSKEERLQKRARGGQGVVIGVSESSLRDWRSATGQSGGISRRMMKMETLGTQVIENHGAGTDWPVVGMAGSSFEHCAGWMFAGVGGVSAPEDFSVEWYNSRGRRGGNSKWMMKAERLEKQPSRVQGGVATLAEIALAVPPAPCHEGFGSNEPLVSVGEEFPEAVFAAQSWSARERHRVLLYDMLKDCIGRHRRQIMAEIEGTYGGTLQCRRTRAHVIEFLETVGFEWQLRGLQCDDNYNMFMLELFPHSIQVVDMLLAPAVYVTETQFVLELDVALRSIQGIPQPVRDVPTDETVYGTVQCYVPSKSTSWRVGGIGYAPLFHFSFRHRTVEFPTQELDTCPPVGERVRFNMKSVQRDVRDDAYGWVQGEAKYAFTSV